MRSHSVARLSIGVKAVLILALALTSLGASSAQARNSNLDPVTWYVAPTGNDANPCTAFDAPCQTINGAIGKAAPGDIIKVAIGTYTGTGTEVVLVEKDITLLGGWDESFSAQTGRSTVDGGDARRGVFVNPDVTAAIDRFAVQHGFASDDGGGILSDGTLTLSNSIISNSSTENYYPTVGGGIHSYGPLTISNSIITGNRSARGGGIGISSEAALSLSNSTVSGNWAGMDGGGIRSFGTIILISSVISDNSAGEMGGGIDGGGMTIIDSTIRNNTVRDPSLYGGGGGIFTGYGSVELSNTTISGNKSARGSGMLLLGGGSSIVLNNTTVSGNTGGEAIRNDNYLTVNNSTITGNTSGIVNESGTTTVRNSIIAGNIEHDCSGSITSAGYNIIGRKTPGCNLIESTGDKIGTEASPINPLLTPLVKHGGPTLTHALISGSPALNAGNPAVPGSDADACLATDQRGVARPVDGACDIGAYEGHVTSVLSILRLDPNPTSAPSVRFRVRFSEAVTGVDTVTPFTDFSLTKTGITGGLITSVSGSGSLYTVTVKTGSNNGTLRVNVLDHDTILDSSSTPLGGPGTGNANYTAGQTYTIRKIPTLISPVNISTWDRTPTYKWSKIPQATQYSYQLWRGTALVYSKPVLASACGVTNCQYTPTTLLPPGAYKWRVRALTQATWKPYSAYKSFTSLAPRAGFWKSTYEDFHVTPDMSYVQNFSTYIYVQGCGNYKITRTVLVPIKGNKFSFTGTFYASGTFDTPSRAHGTDGLTKFYIPGCGYVSGGPWTWSAVWVNGSQPVAVQVEGDLAILLLPELGVPFRSAFRVDPLP